MNKAMFYFLAGVLAGMLLVPGAYAQEDEAFSLEEIIVTAERRAANLQKTPVSIQTLSGEELVTESKQRIDDIMRGIVGVSSQGSQVGTDFYMRGLGTADYGPPLGGVNQSAVAVMIDGVYQNRGEVVRGGTLDMARVEVLRGTQSTTLGGSSLAGAVNLVSNDPDFEYEGSGSLGIGDYHLVTTQAVLNVPLSDSQAVRIAYSTEKRDGYLSSNAGNSDLVNARVKYRWQPAEILNIVATWNHQDIGGNGVDTGVLTYSGTWEGYDPAKVAIPGPPGTPPVCENPSGCYDVTMGDPAILGHMPGEDYEDRDNPWDDGYPADQWPNSPFRNTTIDQYSINIDWDLGIGTLSVTPSYQKAHFQSAEPPRGNSWRQEDQKQETTQLDVQLTSPADVSFEWLGGVYYYDTEFSNLMPTVAINGSNPPGPPGGPCDPGPGAEHTWCWSSTDPNKQKTYAAYADLSYPVLDRLTLNAGARYTKDEKSTRGAGDLRGTAAGPDGTFEYRSPTKGEWEDVTYRLGSQYQLTDQTMLYAMFATGYQPGTISMGQVIEKQTLEQWTAGVKTRVFGNRLQVNVEGFHSTYHDRPMQGVLNYFSPNYIAVTGQNMCGNGMPDSPPYTYGVDAVLGEYACYSSTPTIPDMTSKGIDLELSFILTEKDRLDTSVEYLQSEMGKPSVTVTQSDLESFYGGNTALAAEGYSALTNLAGQYDGLTMQNSPEWSANVSYSHLFDLPDGSTLTPKFNMEYRDTYWSQGGGPGANIVMPGDSIQDAYTLFNVYLSWTSADDRFNISAYVKNIEDEAVKTNIGVEPDPFAPQYLSLAPPRTFGAVLSVNF